MKKNLFLLVLLASFSKSYAEHVLVYDEDFSLKTEGEKVYLVKKYYSNSNKIAITSYEKYLLPFDSKEAHIVMTGEEDENELIIANANDYYFVEYFRDYTKNMKQCVRAVKMFPTNSVTQTFRNNCFYVNGKWVRVAMEDGELTPMPDFPKHPTVIAELEHTTLLKDKNFVYEYDNRTYTLKKIEGLNAKTVQFQKTNSYYKNLLYDDNAFYVMDYNGTDLMEITKDLRTRGCNRKFTEATFIRYRSEGELYEQYLLDFKDGNLWSCDTYANYRFVLPIKNATYVKALEMVKTSEGYYISLRYDDQPIDMSAVRNLNKLHKVKYAFHYLNESYDLYTDGEQQYICLYNISRHRILYPLQVEKRVWEAFTSKQKYYHYEKTLADESVSTEIAVVGNQLVIYKITALFCKNYLEAHHTLPIEIVKEIPLTSEVKDLKMCYATRDKLIINNIIIDNIADFNTLIFVAAIYTYDPQQNEYIYKSYFKDKNSVYSYSEKSQEMIKENYDPKTFDEEAMWKLRVRQPNN
ncbi:hypothetical protein [Capnocytophaga genosp. AHN8471]|uniref:hypothetical protein n=1 Tax=Capnocytophaga genosp. AHN8471 TaxID=327574 RepID=UPI001934389D|nr:hypothetical protein [Capnocytophaga genosp. AHN8471]MBM0658807.1 hypothetical protein [Capnocytophaga genosp. AHN8471]